MKKWLDNYNDSKASAPEGMVGDGFSNVGRNYSPAWGGQFAMGGSLPGSVGFSYARTKGIPSNGPYAKKTLASAQNGKEMQFYQNGLDYQPKTISRDGSWLSKYDVAQTGAKKFKLKDERDLAYKPAESTNIKKKNFDLEQDKERKNYISQLADQQKETSRRKKLTQDQREREDYNARNEERGSIQAHVPESTWDRSKAIASNPLTAFGYAARNESLPTRFQYGERNALDTPIDFINPLQGVAALSEIPGELGRGEYLNAGLSALDAVDLGVYAKGAMKASKPFLQKGAQQLQNIPTSIAPKLRQGLRTAGPSFNNKERIVHTLDDLQITPQDEIQELHNNLLNKFNTEEGKRRLALLGIDSSKLNPATLSFKSTGSGYFPTDNTMDIDLEEAIKLNMDPQTIYAHETGHWLGKQYGDQSPTLLRQKFYETPIDKEFIASYPENFVDEMLAKNPNVDFNKISKESSAAYMLNQKDEAFPFLREMRQNMLNKSYINDEYDYIPEETINNFIKENPSYDRISSFTEPNSKQSQAIYQQFKDLAVIVPGAIGIGAASQIEQKREGGIIKDDRGQWDHPGEITEIGSNDITMEGVPYDVLGVSDTGDTKLMKPGKNYKFKGKKVTEYPMAKNGLRQEQKGLVNLDQLTNFTNYNKPQPGGWLNKYN